MTPPVPHNKTARPMIRREPIRLDRIRWVDGGFAFVPHRFLRDGFFASLTKDEVALYLLLALVGDRNGVSFYGHDSLCSLLQVDADAYAEARDGLIDQDLIAFDGTRFQVLSLPERPVRTRLPGADASLSGAQRAAIRRSIRQALQATAPNVPGDHDVIA